MNFSCKSDKTYPKSAVMLFIRHRITEAPGSNLCRSERPSRRQALSGSVSLRLEPHLGCGSSLLCAHGRGFRVPGFHGGIPVPHPLRKGPTHTTNTPPVKGLTIAWGYRNPIGESTVRAINHTYTHAISVDSRRNCGFLISESLGFLVPELLGFSELPSQTLRKTPLLWTAIRGSNRGC